MSIKKKLATAVATAGLLAGLFGSAFVPAARADDFATRDIFGCQTAADTATCSQVTGGQVTLGNHLLGENNGQDNDGNDSFEVAAWVTGDSYLEDATTYYLSVSSNAHWVSVANADADLELTWGDTAGEMDGINDSTPHVITITTAVDGDDTVDADDVDLTLALDDDEAGEATVKLYYFDTSGVKQTLETHVVTFADELTGGALNADDSTVGLVTAAADCDADSDGPSGTDEGTVETEGSAAYDSTTDIFLCLILRNEDGDLINGTQNANIDVEAQMTLGEPGGDDGANTDSTSDTTFAALDDGGGDDAGVVDGGAVAANDGTAAMRLVGESQEGTGILTVTITHADADLGIDVEAVWSFEITWYGDVASITVTNNAYALGLGCGSDTAAAEADAGCDNGALDDGTSDSGYGLLSVVAKDSAGNVVDLNSYTTDDADTQLVVDSDADDAVSEDAGDNDAEVTDIEIDEVAADDETYISLVCDNTVAEKLSISVIVENDAGDDITSNVATFYCSDAIDSIESVEVESASVEVGGTVDVEVTVLDENGYPVPDGTSVSGVTSAGNFTDSSVGTEDGVATFTYLAGGTSGVASMVFTAGSEEATASVVVGNTGTLTVSPKTKAVADFGVGAANLKITFTLERISNGSIFTYVRKANANGIATFTLRKTGRFEVTASFGDAVTETKIMRKK